MREHQYVTRLEGRGSGARNAGPAETFEDDVVGNHMPRAWQNNRREGLRPGYFRPPGGQRLRNKEQGAGKLHHPQDIRQGVGPPVTWMRQRLRLFRCARRAVLKLHDRRSSK